MSRGDAAAATRRHSMETSRGDAAAVGRGRLVDRHAPRYGNYARIHAFAAARRAPDRVDAACTSDDCVGDATCTVRCPVPPPSCVGLVEDFNSGLRVGEDVAGETVGLDTFRRHKYPRPRRSLPPPRSIKRRGRGVAATRLLCSQVPAEPPGRRVRQLFEEY